MSDVDLWVGFAGLTPSFNQNTRTNLRFSITTTISVTTGTSNTDKKPRLTPLFTKIQIKREMKSNNQFRHETGQNKPFTIVKFLKFENFRILKILKIKN